MEKLLVICGPTSTGKTSLAIRLAKKFNGEIVSADSRQVYKMMNVGTGKDLPKGAKIKVPWFSKYGYYEVKGVKIWGYDLVDPRREFSVAQYLKFANKVIADITKRKSLPILTGGTGLYIKGVVDGISTAAIPKNIKLRQNLSERGVRELFEMLAQVDPVKAASLNMSDKKNPRRLIRAIEVSSWKINHFKKEGKKQKKALSPLFIGLLAPRQFLFKRIDKRVAERVKGGIEKEIKDLLKHKVTWNSQSMFSLGYRQWKDYFEKREDKDKMIKDWRSEEKKYARRQLTWFKKDKRVNWCDITQGSFPKNVESLVEKWYSGKDAKEN